MAEVKPESQLSGLAIGTTAFLSERRDTMSVIRMRKYVDFGLKTKPTVHPKDAIYEARKEARADLSYETSSGRIVKLPLHHATARMFTVDKAYVDLYYAQYEEPAFDIKTESVQLGFEHVGPWFTDGKPYIYNVPYPGVKIEITTIMKEIPAVGVPVNATNGEAVGINTKGSGAALSGASMAANTVRYDGMRIESAVAAGVGKPRGWKIVYTWTYTPHGWTKQVTIDKGDPSKYGVVDMYPRGSGFGGSFPLSPPGQKWEAIALG